MHKCQYSYLFLITDKQASHSNIEFEPCINNYVLYDVITHPCPIIISLLQTAFENRACKSNGNKKPMAVIVYSPLDQSM